MSEKLFIDSINKLIPEVLDQEMVLGIYTLLNSSLDRKVRQAAYNKLNQWKQYKLKMNKKPELKAIKQAN